MLRRLESHCTGGSDGARESEEVKVKGGKREGGREEGGREEGKREEGGR